MAKNSETKPDRLLSVHSLEGLSPQEIESVNRAGRPSAALIHETIRAEGESELRRPVSALLASGFAAGLSMGLSLLTEGLLHEQLPDASWRDLVTSFGYSFGFLIVILGRQQLFTENTLTPILPLLHHPNLKTLRQVLTLWMLVLAANIAATWVFALGLAEAPAFNSSERIAFLEVSRHALENDFEATFIKAGFAGWLIALMVWLLPSAGAARPLVIILVTYVVGIAGLAHIIVGSVEAAYLVVMKDATFGAYVFDFFLPTLLGNVLGGVLLVAVLNHGQIARELKEED
ncbi:formate/nitrite transporter family protein [Nitratireductor basaltis]|uniref:Inner membrane protein YfdC n=1 Tax=Nitratireductor basaltis TaxID=472175 RepID=A0A084UEA1_9HYPH|nr:formate/nitrite transporter family protein [Nitratireductor basaltis]KFB11287.1 Inner membrane protein YfdC [Nitratireductor basaltis]